MSAAPDLHVEVDRFETGMSRVVHDVRFGGDVDGDGRFDIAAYQFDFGSEEWFLDVWSRDGVARARVPANDEEQLGVQGRFALGGDFDGDGLADVLATSGVVVAPIVRAFSAENGVIYERSVAEPGCGISSIAAGPDLTGDGLANVVTGRNCDGRMGHVELRDAQFDVIRAWVEPDVYVDRVEFTPDRDGDGLADVLFTGRDTCVAFGSLSGAELGRFASSGFRDDLIACDDLDGDGRWDGIYRAEAGGVFMRLADGTNRRVLEEGWVFPVGDINGDGNHELWVVDEVTLQVRVEDLRGAIWFIEPVHAEIRVDPTRDLDGDGLRELGVATREPGSPDDVVIRFRVPTP